ncbi:MAG TPA: C45 family autoproteolytic acyltransferase/hydrolase [Gemmataceae bacterium]|nr:C45 family autoproteolytic acyltransferase/hydrolase [Gemmataceae bacterium]
MLLSHRLILGFAGMLFCSLPGLVQGSGAGTSGSEFVPDPASVQRLGPAYRYPQAGWIVLHIEGEPYERGYQHGKLLAGEIADYINTLATARSPKAPAESWRDIRLLVNSLFLRRYEKEYLEEMKGIADGAAAAGAKFDGKHLELLDIVALNSGIELDFLEDNLKATPTGLEGQRFREPPFGKAKRQSPEHCSAFAATAPATADGKIVFGHITMFDLYHVRHYNVWLDVKPSKGHRILMQSFPGGIMSGVDYYLNDAGLLVAETTIAQTRFDIHGSPLVSRIRQTLQYADSIDEAVRLLGQGNNGLYSNEWLLADIKTNEIAMFELGTHKSRLWRSSKNEWIGGTEGFYWGCNNTKDLQVRLETVPSVEGKPANMCFCSSPRDRTWLRLYEKHKGKIGADFGLAAFSTPPLVAFPSCDAKFTTSALAKDLKSWALFGPPLGRTWDPTDEERKKYPDIRPLVSNDWTVLHAKPPAENGMIPVGIDLAFHADKESEDEKEIDPATLPPAWHGTLLPKTDADIWLAAAFAEYEKVVALEKSLKAKAKDGKLCSEDREKLALALFGPRSRYLSAQLRLGKDLSLDEVTFDFTRSDWYDLAVGKGILLLADLRRAMGEEAFDKLMDDFGRANAGKPVAAAQFYREVEKVHGKPAFNPKTTPSANGLDGSFWSIYSFFQEPEHVLIIYGTLKDRHAQREAAQLLQRKISRFWMEPITNYTVPIKADIEVTDEDLKKNHLLLIGTPEANSVAARCRHELPVNFGTGSFVVKGKVYAHPASAVISAGPNPQNPRYSVVLFAGLSAEATWRCVQRLPSDSWNAPQPAPVLLLAAGAQPKPLAGSTKNHAVDTKGEKN